MIEQLEEVLELNAERAKLIQNKLEDHPEPNWEQNEANLAKFFSEEEVGRDFAGRGNVFYSGDAGHANMTEQEK